MKIYNIVNIPRGLSEEFVCDCQEEYNSGYTAGEENGFDKGYDSGFTDGVESVDCTDFYNSGVTDGFNSGYTSGTTDGYDSGVTAGEEIQKSKLTTLTVLENGVYSREDGYNEVNVQVPAASGAGYDSGFTDGYESGYTDGSEDGYESGFTGGYDSGVTDGKEAQKALMTTLELNITQNGSITGSRTNGWNRYRLNVNTPSGATIKNQNKRVEISGGTFETINYEGHKGYYWADTFITADSGYTGLGTVSALTTLWADDAINYGTQLQKNKLTQESFSDNGTYTREDGWSAVTVQVDTDSYYHRGYDSGYTDGLNAQGGDYASGYTDGEKAQKAKLGFRTITGNGYYTRTDGWSAVSVNVQTTPSQSGKTVNVDESDLTWNNGEYSLDLEITPDAGYSAMTQAEVDMHFIPTSAITYGYNSGYTAGYDSGFTDGYNSAATDNPGYDEGFEAGRLSGITEQKSKLGSYFINTNGTFTRENGWSSVTVDIDTSAVYQEGYNSGYTDGERDGFDNGYNSGYQTGFTEGYDSGHTDGYQEGYDSGFTDGAASVDCADFYNSGVTDGENNQKVKLSSTTITQNGTYTRADGWSAVTVNVAQTGYTQQDLDNAYASGWSGGYDSGYTDGQEDCSGSTAATAMTVSVPQGMIPGETRNTTVSTRPRGVETNLSYSSSNTDVATIDSNGVITAVNFGTTNICVVDSISDLTSCTQLNVAVPASGNADVTLYIRNSGSSSEETNLCASAFVLTLEEMRVDGVTVTPTSSMTLSPGMHVIEFNVRSNYHKIIQQAFWQNSAYAAVVSPRSVHPSFELEYGAFMRSNITSVSLNEGVTTVSASTFAYCYNLTGVSLPQSCTGIVAPSLCLGDANLQSVNYGSGITKIGNSAFSGCTSLTSVTIPNTITYIGTNAYRTCTGITSVDIGNGITGMGVNVFEDCTSLTSVTFGNNLGGTIPGYMFRNCTALTDCILPVGITAIGQEAFMNTALSEIVIPEGVTTIGKDAFRSGDYVTAVTLPETITEIGQGAFADLVLNTRITIYAGSAPTLGATSGVNASFGTPGATIYVPAGSLFIYKDAWPVYADYMQGFV